MTVATAFLRIIAALVLILPIFFGFSYYLGAIAIGDTLLKPATLIESLEENDAYNRIYDEFLLNPEFNDWVDNLVGGFQLSDRDKVKILREVIPPEFIQAETERNITSIVGYLNGDVDDLQVFIDSREHMDKIKPAVFNFIEAEIDSMSEKAAFSTDELTQETRAFILRFSVGQIPINAPRPVGFTPSEISRSYRESVDQISRSSSVPPEVTANLERRDAAIQRALQDENFKAALTIAAQAAAEPFIDATLTELDGTLDDMGRFDLVEWIGSLSDITRSEVLDDANFIRDGIRIGVQGGAIAALVVMGLATFAMALVFLPHWRHVMFWPGVVLLLAGLLFLTFGWWLTLDIPGLDSDLCDEGAEITCGLTVDVVRSLASDVGNAFIIPSVIVTGIGSFAVFLAILFGGRRKQTLVTEDGEYRETEFHEDEPGKENGN